MTEQAGTAELHALRARIATLEAARDHGTSGAPARPADMDGFRQLNDAIVENRLQSFFWHKGSSPAFRYAVLGGIVLIWLLILVNF